MITQDQATHLIITADLQIRHTTTADQEVLHTIEVQVQADQGIHLITLVEQIQDHTARQVDRLHLPTARQVVALQEEE